MHRLIRLAGLEAQVGYRKSKPHGGEQQAVTRNVLDREFDPQEPNQAWVTDITYIKSREGWMYLGTIMDLYSRRINGWSMSNRITKELVLDALLMAVLQRKSM